MLDAEINTLRQQMADHGDKLSQASNLIGDMRNNASALENKMNEAALKFSSLEGQFKILATKI